MDKTPFSKRVEILHDFYLDYSGSDEYDDFILLNDLGLPAAVLSMMGAVTLTDIGISYVENTWRDFCELIEVDHMGNYNSLSQMLDMEDE